MIYYYYIAGKSRYAMVLECRNTSNTCQNLMRTHKCALNFITDERENFREAVRLGFPGPYIFALAQNMSAVFVKRDHPEESRVISVRL